MRQFTNSESGNQFQQITESFFRVYPFKSHEALFCYVELQSNVNATDFREWFMWRKK